MVGELLFSKTFKFGNYKLSIKEWTKGAFELQMHDRTWRELKKYPPSGDDVLSSFIRNHIYQAFGIQGETQMAITIPEESEMYGWVQEAKSNQIRSLHYGDVVLYDGDLYYYWHQDDYMMTVCPVDGNERAFIPVVSDYLVVKRAKAIA